MAASLALPWNTGESALHEVLRVPNQDNPTAGMLTAQASYLLQRAPLLALGTLDAEARPWTTIWGGEAGFSEPLGGSFIGTTTLVDGKFDPVVQALKAKGDGNGDGEVLRPHGGKMAGLTIDLITRKRVKIAGTVVAGVVREVEREDGADGDKAQRQDQIQLVTKIEQSLGNCPKYLNQYTITPAPVTSELVSQGPGLTDAAKDLINKADMFFLSTSTDVDMDTNHRGGAPGFVRIVSSTQIAYPEYSGNRLYQSLGNLRLNPAIGLTFPDYETGNVLYTTGKASILVGTDAARLLPGSNLAVLITFDEVRFVAQGLPFRGARKDGYESPYNPAVRRLATEGNIKTSLVSVPTSRVARLVKKTLITPSLARFTFAVPGGIQYQPGQWIALDFKADLDIGYSHMRNDDPRSLNDDFVRTFTISSAPSTEGKDSEFDITIRAVGPVTRFLFQQNERAGIEIPILGIGGSFRVAQASEEGVTPFVAGGVGITPLLGQLGGLDVSVERFKLMWTVRAADIDFVVETLRWHGDGLAACTEVFFTGEWVRDADKEKVKELKALGVRVERRRMQKTDVEAVGARVWYVCAGKQLTKAVAGWVGGSEVVSEGFDY
jgi:ferredoxin-NADP reductase/predicted pyridoxine 5'-phosphate oxidase superfamily flavin-nucleotide-binding protein